MADKKVLSEEEISAMRAEIQSNLAEAEDVLAQAQALLSQVDHLQSQLDSAEGDLRILMPEDRYAEEERIAFVGSVEMFVQDCGDWVVDYEKKQAEKASAQTKKPSRKGKHQVHI